MESLLSLTSRRAGEWFKEELRSQGALDHIVDTSMLSFFHSLLVFCFHFIQSYCFVFEMIV